MGSEETPPSRASCADSSAKAESVKQTSDSQPQILHPIPVLGLSVLETAPPLVDVYVDLIEDRKLTSKVIKNLCAVRPIASLHHLKRVRNFYIILDYVGEDSPEACLERLKRLGLDTEGLRGRPEVRQVPAQLPRTRKQFEAANAVWPCSFREDKYLESVLSQSAFSPGELHQQVQLMGRCLEAAAASRRVGGDGVGALVADPTTGAVVAVAYDDRGRHPLKHAVMLLVEMVSRDQGGGYPDWELDRLPLTSADVGSLEAGTLDGQAKEETCLDKCPGRDSTGTTELLDSEVDSLAQCYREMLEKNRSTSSVRDCSAAPTARDFESTSETSTLCRDMQSKCADVRESTAPVPNTREAQSDASQAPGAARDAASAPVAQGEKRKRAPAGDAAGDADTEGEAAYLCTGLDVFVTREPCFACAMALLHSRARRVFYGCANPAAGALGSLAAIHTLPGVNHRFQVFRGVLEDKCVRALRDYTRGGDV